MFWCAVVAPIQSQTKMPFELSRPSRRAAADRALPLYIAPDPSLFFRWVKVRRLHLGIHKY
jgi:hypothetical protein